MKKLHKLVRKCLVGAALTSAGWASTNALAQMATIADPSPPAASAKTANSATSALAQADPVPYWWFHGTVEAGGRFFVNNPQQNGSMRNLNGAYVGQNSLAKYYEYSTIKPGPFSNIVMSTGSKDGLYQIDLGGQNIGYDDQSYYLDLSKAGEHYLSLGWDQTPHLYSTSAQTPYFGIGTNALTLPGGLRTLVKAGGITTANVNPFLNQTDIGIHRDTASAAYRWTPSDPWDIKADYSYMRRTGTQIDGVVGISNGGLGGSGAGTISVPRPVADSTQNYGLNGEYVGTSFWGQKLNFKLAYNGSQYMDDWSSYTIQSPFCTGTTNASCAAGPGSPVAALSLWPSNQANGGSGTLAADLPWQSRYVGTASYTKMTQNSAFIPMTNNPSGSPALPASSLNGNIDTILVNNVVTTKITPELTSKLTYRYYDFANNTPEIAMANWIKLDCTIAGLSAAGGACGKEPTQSSLSISYTKQNAGEELNWRPSREWNFGAAYGYEHYDWSRADVTKTNENSGKVYADWKPTSWVTARSSGYYSNRRYDSYNMEQYVGSIQNPTTAPSGNGLYVSPAFQQMMFSNRQRWQANFALDLVAFRGVTITPTVKYRNDQYALDSRNQMGLTNSETWSAGVDVVYAINPRTSIMAGYMWDRYSQLLYNSTSTTNNAGAITSFPGRVMPVTDTAWINTFVTGARYEAIPDKLDLDVRYSLSNSVDATQGFATNLTSGLPLVNGQFPNVVTWWQRLDATATYKFDNQVVAQFGGKGEVKAKLHYVWERNSVGNWSQDPLAPVTPTISANSIFLASDNPNYNIHMLMASLAYTW
jgi:MtrB/PioB family decaheme-associated outer membrane protein